MGLRDEYDTSAVLTAFSLVLGAGCATGIGAAAVFSSRLVKFACNRTLAASLGLASGVMLYVSLVDIYGKAISGFQAAGHEEGKAFKYATAGFFGGIFLMKALDFVVDILLQKKSLPLFFQNEKANKTETTSAVSMDAQPCEVGPAEMISSDEESQQEDEDEGTGENKADNEATQRKGLIRLGAATALAIAMHNLPEGLVTFISYMDEPAVGTVLAVAIGIHNIPEGLCVAMPIFYATKSRSKAFCWGILSGASEPIGALIGYFILGGSFSGNANGILFSMVSGIMTMLVVDELLPSAHRHDPKNTVVTWSVIFGMAAMAISLILFSS